MYVFIHSTQQIHFFIPFLSNFFPGSFCILSILNLCYLIEKKKNRISLGKPQVFSNNEKKNIYKYILKSSSTQTSLGVMNEFARRTDERTNDYFYIL